MHEKQNSLSIRGRNIGDYARLVLRALYSNDELLDSILPPGGAHFRCKLLDNQRFEKLHGKYVSRCATETKTLRQIQIM